MKLSDKAQASLDSAIAKFKAGDLSAVVKMARINLPEDAPARKWSFTNQVLAMAQTDSLDNRTYKQWKAVGRQVQKGSFGGFIIYPRMVPDKDSDEEGKMKLIGFGTTSVFAYHDTEGEEIPEYSMKDMPPLIEVAHKFGVDIGYEPMIGALGYCTLDAKNIRLATPDEHVFFHELAHAAHKQVKNNRDEEMVGGQDAHQETVADLTACVLMEMFGLRDDTGNTWKYISHYNEDPLKAIMKAVRDVEGVLAVIFEEAPVQ